jgi:hypothetical protein
MTEIDWKVWAAMQAQDATVRAYEALVELQEEQIEAWIQRDAQEAEEAWEAYEEAQKDRMDIVERPF